MTQAITNNVHDIRINYRKPAKKEPGRILLTRAHFEYYRQQKAPLPCWAESFSENERKVSVNDLINAQVTTYQENRQYNCLHSTLNIVGSNRRRGTLRESLANMAANPGCSDRPERRAAYCRKWLRIIRERNDQ